jgi:hypothetical protein
VREVEAEPREEAWEAERDATPLPPQYADQLDVYGEPLCLRISRVVSSGGATGVGSRDFSLYS